VQRIIWHWTAGGYRPTALDLSHYHLVIDGDGVEHLGSYRPEANRDVHDGHYAAHTRSLNTGSIGISCAAMAGAQESPFSAGRAPLLDVQVRGMIRASARMCRTYGIEVSRETTLSHAEVQPTLGVRQRGKWDIAWLPGMDRPGDPVEVGDRLRDMLRVELSRPASTAVPLRLLTVGDVQSALRLLGYDPGPTDGIMGGMTRGAIRGFYLAEGITELPADNDPGLRAALRVACNRA
jgi:hypothetical protein